MEQTRMLAETPENALESQGQPRAVPPWQWSPHSCGGLERAQGRL